METSADWAKVCRISDLGENALRPVEVNGIAVLVVNGATRRLVIPQSCPHMRNALADGAFDGHTLTCLKHLWQWSVDEGGLPKGIAEAPLLCYETQERDGDLFCRATQELRYEHDDEDEDDS